MPSWFPLLDAIGQGAGWLGNATIDAADAGFDLFTGQWGQPGILRSLLTIGQNAGQGIQGQIQDANLPKVAQDSQSLAEMQALGGNNLQFNGARYDQGKAATPIPAAPAAAMPGMSPIASALTPQQAAIQAEIGKNTALNDQIVKQLQGLTNPYGATSPLYQRLMAGATDDAWASSSGGERAIANDYGARGMAGTGQAAAAQAVYEDNRAHYIDSAQRQAALQLTQMGSDWQNNNLAMQAQIKNSDPTLAALQQLSGNVNQNAQFYANLAQSKDLSLQQMGQQDRQFWADLGLRTDQGNRAADAQAGAGILNAAVVGGSAILPYLIPGLNAAAPLISGAASNAANWLMSGHGNLPSSYFQNTTPQAAGAVGKAGPSYPAAPVQTGTVPNYYDPAAQRGGIQNQAAWAIGGVSHPTPTYAPNGLGYSPIVPQAPRYGLQSVPGNPASQQLTGYRGVQLRR